MKKNYNYTRGKLIIPEYGRHIQGMVESLIKIEDREERNRQAHAVIAVMGNLNPMLRDTSDFTHKLWDHLFIISDFKLDVDSPYEQPSRQALTAKPRIMSYSQSRIRHKHYGKYTSKILVKLSTESDPKAVEREVDNMARYMRSKSFEYNQEHPNNEQIIKDIKLMSNGNIDINEDAINNIKSEYKNTSSQYQHKGQQRNHSKNRGQFQSRNNTKNGGQRRNVVK